MSPDAKPNPSTTYAVTERLDKTISYDCARCPHSAPDVDAARAHRAVHVAGPELFDAAKSAFIGLSNGKGAVPFIITLLRVALRKADPTFVKETQ